MHCFKLLACAMVIKFKTSWTNCMVTVKKTKQKKTEYVVHKSTAVMNFVPVRSNYSCTQIVLPQISPKFIVSLWYTVCSNNLCWQYL